jgi:hypothetical protein
MSEPLAEYNRRLGVIAASDATLRKRDNGFVAAKTVVGAAVVASAVWLVKYHPARISLLLVPVLLFLLLFVLHERVLRQLRRIERLKNFYIRGLDRIENRWADAEDRENGARFLDSNHPYARDLDIFGQGSLYSLLCTARTRSGEETLAAWLKSAAPIPEILSRQEAVRELTPRLDFREALALAGDEARGRMHPEALLEWAEGGETLNRTAIRALAVVLTLLWILTLCAWWRWDWMMAALAMSLINLGVNFKLRGSLSRAASGVDGAQHDLALLSAILARIETEPAGAPKLAGLKSRLASSGLPASYAIRLLGRRLAWLESHDNWFVKILDPFVFWRAHCVVAIEGWRATNGAAVREWLAVTGEVEALTSLATYAYEHPGDTFPELADGGPFFAGEGVAHPLLPREQSVGNDLRLDAHLRLLVISGPNMAGKSTFIRSIGINAVLALSGAPVCARRLRLSSLQVAASICILDSLQGGLSRFYAEITRLKQIDELSRNSTPVLFLLDELLSGTNSHDRRVGTECFVRSLLSRQAIGLVTTHDLALAEIAERIGPVAANYHFEDSFEGGKLHFDYKLTPGIVQTTNALLLMRSIGLDV